MSRKNRTIAKLEKSDLYHNILLKISQGLHIRIIEDNFTWNKYNVLIGVFTIYALVAYIYNLVKFWDDFDFVCFCTILNAPILSGIYRLFNWYLVQGDSE